MPRAVLKSSQYSAAADQRLRDAGKLVDRQRWLAAVYLSGYGVECSMKAELMVRLQQIGGWLGNESDPLYELVWTHDLVAIADGLGYPEPLLEAVKNFYRGWKVTLRYSSRGGDRHTAEDMLRRAESIARDVKMRALR